jgi:chemotaxis protein histidine kinase CheA
METAEAQIGGLEIYLRKWKPGILDRRMLTAVRRKLNLFSKSALKAGRADIVKSVNRSLDALDANESKKWTQEEIDSFTAISEELRTLVKPGANRAHQEVVDKYRADLDAAYPATRRLEINPEYVEMMEALVSDFTIYSLQVRKELERMKPLMKSRAHLWLDGMSSDLERFAHAFAESCRRLHLVALSKIFDRFPRLVREVAKRKGKSVQLQISGGEIELDKSQVEKLAEPLEHLIRNAVDHGLELADERKAQGKNEKGVLSVRADAKKESVTIEIEDDGTGIDFDAVRRKATELKLIGQDKSKSMPAEELMQFVFLTGLSTKDVPDTISGRGVGMDIVRQAIRELGGQLEVDSKPAKGTLFRLIIPLNQDI